MDQIERFLKECNINLSAEFKNDLAIKFNGKFKYLKDKIRLLILQISLDFKKNIFVK